MRFFKTPSPVAESPLAGGTPPHPIFLSVVVILRNQSKELVDILRELEQQAIALASDYEIIVVDNASIDVTRERLRDLTRSGGHPNIHVVALPYKVPADLAAWTGIEQAIGDFVAVIDPIADDMAITPSLLERAVAGHDIVYARNSYRPRQALHYRVLSRMFHLAFHALGGRNVVFDPPRHRALSRKVVNHLMGQGDPSLAYRCLTLDTGFVSATVEHTSTQVWRRSVSTRESIDRGIQILLTVSKLPLRIATGSLLVLSGLHTLVTLVSLSVGSASWDRGLLSLMLLALALSLAVIGEYLLKLHQAGRQLSQGLVPARFSSEVITSKERLNIDSAEPLRGPEAPTGSPRAS